MQADIGNPAAAAARLLYHPAMTFRLALVLLLLCFGAGATRAEASRPSTEPPEVASLRSDRTRSAEALLVEAERWGESAANRLASGWSKLAMGEFCDETEQPERAYALLDEAAAIAASEHADDLAIAARSRLASMYANRGDAARAAVVLGEMETVAKAAGRVDWQALWTYNRGVLERKLGHFDAAIGYFDQSAALALAGQDRHQQARSLNALGLVLARMGKFADALAHHHQALDLARATGDSSELARTYRMLGFLHRNLDDEELAAQNIREALKHLGPRDVREGIALRGELSRSLLEMGQTEEAARFGEEAANASIQLGSPPNKVNSFTALSDARLAQGHIDEAADWSRRAFELYGSVAIRDQVQIHANRMRVARVRGDLQNALKEGRATVEGARKLGDKVLERTALDELSDIELANGEVAAAMATRKAFQELDKTLAIDIAGRRVAILEGSLAAQRAETERTLLARDNQIQALRITRQRIVGVGLIVLLLLLAGFSLLSHRRYQETRRLHAALAESSIELQRVANTDALTGIANRGAIVARFEQVLAAIQSRPQSLAVLLIDIDHFKRINDQHGHLAGDVVLREAAQRMRAALPQEAHFGRWGGEEFIVLLEGTEPKRAAEVAEAVRVAIDGAPFLYGDVRIRASVSIGVAAAECPERRGIDRLVATADAALYRAKNAGRNRVELA